MDVVFLKILNMSITASWLILAVVVLRFVLKKAPKAIICALWTIVAVRLICPFSLESVFSLIPSTETVSPDILYSQTPGITSGIPAINSAVNPVITGSLAPEAGASVNPIQLLTIVASCVWLVGIAVMLGYATVSYLRIKKKVREGSPLRDNIWLCDHIDTPFILGVLRPRIYLPSAIGDARSNYVVAHENAHLKRHDHWWKPLGFLLLTIYWFNPLCWLAYVLLCRDIEVACDEKVVRDWGAHDKKAYSEALLSCSVPRRMVAACPLAFGEVGVKERVKTVLNYKKPAFWIIVVAVVACVVVAVCFLTNPKPDMPPQEGDAQGVGVRLISEISPQSESMTIEWINTSDNEAVYGDTYDIQRFENGEWVSCAKTEVVFHMPAYSLRAGESVEKEYGLANYDLARPGEYRFTAKFHFQKDVPITEDESHMVWIGFKIETLSLNDVITLSQKGEKLTWADFDGYAYTDIGSGLYIRVYEIDEQFSLMIGGGSTEESPMYIRLVSEANQDDYIDIRTGDVEAFIAARQSLTDVPLTIVSNGKTVTPYQNFLWASDWTDGGWLEADGMPVLYKLSEIAAELHVVTLGDDFTLIYGDNASFSYLSVFDESYERIYHNVTLDRLSALPSGMYYISVVVMVQGDYIPEDEKNEATGYECVFKLIVPDATVGGAEQSGFIYQTAYSWANYSEDGYAAMVERAENRDAERRYGNIEHLTPVVKLDSKVEFDDFYEEMSAFFDLTQSYDEVGAFNAQAAQYTEEFFAEQSLFIAYLEENTTSNRHKVEEVRIENGTLEIRICQIAPDSFDTAMAGWFIAVAVSKADITNCTGFDAYICATVHPDRQIPSGKLLRTYAYAGDDDPMHTAAVSLYDSGEFIFTFSPISSYIGHGAYTMENDRLTLQTDDGNYTYVFDVVNDTLVFDGGASSTATWYSGFTNGAVFD